MDKAFESQGCVVTFVLLFPLTLTNPSLVRFTWFSGDRLMSDQKAVFRVNCIDCLDRTNVVQVRFPRLLGYIERNITNRYLFFSLPLRDMY